MDSHWVIWVDTPHQAKAQKFLDRIARRMQRKPTSIKMEPYPKTGGYRVACEIGLDGEKWNDCLVEVLYLGQCVASDWHLLGTVLDDVTGVSQKAKDIGVTMIEWQLWKTPSDTQHEHGGKAESPLGGSAREMVID